jgi:hypothetical protein
MSGVARPRPGFSLGVHRPVGILGPNQEHFGTHGYGLGRGEKISPSGEALATKRREFRGDAPIAHRRAIVRRAMTLPFRFLQTGWPLQASLVVKKRGTSHASHASQSPRKGIMFRGLLGLGSAMKPHQFVLVLGLATIPLAAAGAAPRDDVKAASARCDSISDDHTWLNCYYGAAQPVRAELGLPPAPDAQQNLVPPPDQAAPQQRGFFSRLWPF